MLTKTYETNVESGNVVQFVRILGKIGLRFKMSDEWYVADDLDPAKKIWYRTFRIYATKKQLKLIQNELNKIK